MGVGTVSPGASWSEGCHPAPAPGQSGTAQPVSHSPAGSDRGEVALPGGDAGCALPGRVCLAGLQAHRGGHLPAAAGQGGAPGPRAAGHRWLQVSWSGGGQPGDQPWLESLNPPLPFSLEAVHLGPCSGLLVDWLEMLDPEVVSSCPDLQQRLLFSRSKVSCAQRGAGHQPCHWGAACLPSPATGGPHVCPKDPRPGSHQPGPVPCPVLVTPPSQI